ncbi:MAG: alpha/beta hydrolase [Dehalococcoidia bacterium]|nr:alpha/beta hydrolase [Dehalococcoidia bacterium]
MTVKPRLLLIHGLFSGRAVWNGVIQELGDDADCVSIDLPGYGRTRLHRGPYEPSALAEWLDGVVRRTRPTHIAGHSMGGILALAVAGLEPRGVEGVGLIGLPIFATASEGRAHLNQRGKLVTAVLRWHRATHACCVVAKHTHHLWEGPAGRRFPNHPPELIRAVVDHRQKAHGQALEQIVWSGVVDDLSAGVNLPVAALHGEGDRAAPIEPVRNAAQRWNWDLVVERGANHQVLVDRPDFTARWIRERLLTARGDANEETGGMQGVAG